MTRTTGQWPDMSRTCPPEHPDGHGQDPTKGPVLSSSTESQRTSTERTRRHRERQRQGIRVVRIEVSEDQIDVLVRRGLLGAAQRRDYHALRDLVGRLLHCLLDRLGRPADGQDKPGRPF